MSGRNRSGSLIILFILYCLTCFSPAAFAEDVFEPVKQRLIGEGFSREAVTMAYSPAPNPMYETVARTFIIRESKLNYDQFLDAASIARARKFMAANARTLARAEAVHKVDRNVITAILLVETQFGSYTGKTPVLDIFSTFALMDQKAYKDKIWLMLSPETRDRWSREEFDAKLDKRAAWAYDELHALFRLAQKWGVRPEALKGSVMGAVGWPQFLPSSLVNFGDDGNSDGAVNLYEPEDAIFSVANYFRGHGWLEARDRAAKEQVVWAYNHSTPYIKTVLAIADKLSEPAPPEIKSSPKPVKESPKTPKPAPKAVKEAPKSVKDKRSSQSAR
ncbi:MAG: lytic murein transglycosylase [Acidobacteriota bacterium]